MLADVLTDQLVLGDAVEGRRQFADAVAKARVAHRDVAFVARPAQIDPERLARRPTTQRRAGRPIPRSKSPLPSSQRSSPPVSAIRTVSWLLLLAPPANLLVDPVRGRRLGRGQEDEEARLRERLLDRRPELRRSGEARLVAKDAQSAPPVPGLGERPKTRLKRGRQAAVGRMTVGDESVITRARRCEEPRSLVVVSWSRPRSTVLQVVSTVPLPKTGSTRLLNRSSFPRNIRSGTGCTMRGTAIVGPEWQVPPGKNQLS